MKSSRILSPATLPWKGELVRRHKPRGSKRSDGYRLYRSCLRWEFGFSCAFCLCHETDLMATGTEGWGLTQIEHFVPKSLDETRRDDYMNCFYICSRCNQARWAHPNRDALGRSLLNPCAVSWRDHFTLVDFELLPRRENDRDAEYTIETYELNDPAKVGMRRRRSTHIKERASYFRRSIRREERLLAAAETLGSELVELAQEIYDQRKLALAELPQFPAIPSDAPDTCRCEGKKHHSLPACLQKQTWDLSRLWAGYQSDQGVR